MPIILLIIGAALIGSAIKGTEKQLGAQITSEFTGSNSFLIWGGAIVGIGALGYIPKLERPSNYLLALVLISIFLANGGAFANIVSVLKNPPAPDASVPLSSGTSGATGTGSSGTSTSGSPFDLPGTSASNDPFSTLFGSGNPIASDFNLFG